MLGSTNSKFGNFSLLNLFSTTVISTNKLTDNCQQSFIYTKTDLNPLQIVPSTASNLTGPRYYQPESVIMNTISPQYGDLDSA